MCYLSHINKFVFPRAHIHRSLFPNPSPYSPFDEMDIFNIPLIVIQTTVGRKDLENIKWVFTRFFGHSPQQLVFASLHYALNDNNEISCHH